MVSTRRQRQSHPPSPPPSTSTTSTSSDRKNWEVIFKALKQMLKQQASHLETLLEERTLLQERIQLQYQRWNSDVRLLEDIISQKERQLLLSELGKLVEVSKTELLLSSKQREALINKLKLEHAWSELDDFKAWFDILSHRCPDIEDISPGRLYESLKAKDGGCSISKEALKHQSKLEKEVATLKHEYEKLSVKYASDLSVLKDENNFVWNQYKTMEGSYTDQLKTKNYELNQANQKIMDLLKSMEQLQSEKMEKDETVATLMVKITELEAKVTKKDENISRLSKEFELLRSETTGGIPLLNHCSSEPSSSGLKIRRSSRRKESAALEEEESKLLRSKSSAGMPVLIRCMNEPSSSIMRSRGNARNGRTAAVEEDASFTQQEATIVTLKDKISELEAQAKQKNGEISALSEELKLLKSKSVADTPVLKHCTSRPSSSRSRGRTNVKDRESASLKEKASSSQLVSVQGSTRSKRKQDDVISIDDTPRLFTSQFKIPKLKSQSPLER